MKLIEMKCKNCGAKLKVDSEIKDVHCEFCHSDFKIDDEVKHHKLDDMEKSGYEFEKGRIRAQQENKNENYINNNYLQKNKNRTLWLILAWIFLLPFTATYFILKSNKLDKKKKIFIVVIMWIIFFIIAAIGSLQDEEEKKNRIIECYSQETYDKLDELVGIDNINGYFSNSYTCDKLSLKNKNYKDFLIEMDGKNLISIKLDNKYIYSVDNTVDIYDPITLKIKEKKLIEYYKDDENINKFINLYNNLYPETKITSDMLTVYHHHGSDHKDQVKINIDGFDSIITGGLLTNKVSVYIDNDKNDDVEIKKLIVKIVKVFNSSLKDEDIIEHINSQGIGSNINTFNEIEYWTNKNSDGSKILYIKLTGVIN